MAVDHMERKYACAICGEMPEWNLALECYEMHCPECNIKRRKEREARAKRGDCIDCGEIALRHDSQLCGSCEKKHFCVKCGNSHKPNPCPDVPPLGYMYGTPEEIEAEQKSKSEVPQYVGGTWCCARCKIPGSIRMGEKLCQQCIEGERLEEWIRANPGIDPFKLSKEAYQAIINPHGLITVDQLVEIVEQAKKAFLPEFDDSVYLSPGEIEELMAGKTIVKAFSFDKENFRGVIGSRAKDYEAVESSLPQGQGSTIPEMVGLMPSDPDWEQVDTVAKFHEIYKAEHYNSHPSGVECIEIVEHMNFCLGNVMKYIWRADHKEIPLKNLKKAAYYLNREIQRRESHDNA